MDGRPLSSHHKHDRFRRLEVDVAPRAGTGDDFFALLPHAAPTTAHRDTPHEQTLHYAPPAPISNVVKGPAQRDVRKEVLGRPCGLR